MLKKDHKYTYELTSANYELNNENVSGNGHYEISTTPKDRITLEYDYDSDDNHIASSIQASFESVLKGIQGDQNDQLFTIEIAFNVRFAIDKDYHPTQEKITQSQEILMDAGESSAREIHKSILKLSSIENVSL